MMPDRIFAPLAGLVPDPMAEASAWLDRNLRFWNERPDALGVLVDGDES
jgi:hypothetical protein